MTTHRRRLLRRGVAAAAALAARRARLRRLRRQRLRARRPVAPPTSTPRSRRAARSPYWTWDADAEAQVAGVREEVPERQGQAGQRRDRQRPVHRSCRTRSRPASGVPDVAQIEYYALPQFALAESLADLERVRRSTSSRTTYTPGPWDAVHVGGKRLRPAAGLRPDGAVLQQEGLRQVRHHRADDLGRVRRRPPRKLHTADPKAYITNDTGDAGFTTSMIWQAGGQPVQGRRHRTSRSTSQDAGHQEVDRHLEPADRRRSCSSPIPGWSDEWYKGLGDGTIATLTIGAWMPGDLESGVPDGLRQLARRPDAAVRRHARPPRRTAAARQSVLKQSKNPALAAAFVQWLNATRRRSKIRVDERRLPGDHRGPRRPRVPRTRSPRTSAARRSTRSSPQSAKDVVAGLAVPAVPGLRQQHLQRHRRQGVRRTRPT